MAHFKFLLLFLLLFSKEVLAQNQGGEILKFKSLENIKLEAGQVFKYLINLKKGQFASIKVQQKSVGIGYAIYSPGDSLIDVGDMNALYQTEIINIDAIKNGNYRIEIFWDYGRPQNGEFSIIWDKLEQTGKTAIFKAEQLMNSWYTNNDAGAAVAVLKNGQIVYKSFKGLSNIEYNIPISNKSAFELASCSKQFTGFAIAILIDKGKISLDDDIRKFLPELPDYGKIITVENLVYHTSGLRNWDAMSNSMGLKSDDILTIDMVYKMIINATELNFNPSEKFSYTNTGYNLLALIIERVTNENFEKWMTENVFKPLGMYNTSIKDNVNKVIPNKVSSYYEDENGRKANTDNVSLMGSTSVYSCIDDLIKWVNNLDEKQKGGKKVFEFLNRKTILSNGETFNSYAFGNGFGNHKGISNIEHLGLVSGFRTAISRFPEQNLSVIFLTNDNNDASYNRCWTITDLFLKNIKNSKLEPLNFPDLKESLESTSEAPVKYPVDTKEYEGVYYADEINSHYRIINRKGILIAVSYRFDEFKLKWLKIDNFLTTINKFDKTLEFIRNSDKTISNFKLIGIDKEILFRKVSN